MNTKTPPAMTAKQKSDSNTGSIPLSVIELNKGQIPGRPKTPRFSKNEAVKIPLQGKVRSYRWQYALPCPEGFGL